MPFELILQNISRYITLTTEEKDFFTSLLHPKTVKRKQVHFKEGDICKDTTFVVAGCLRGYMVDKNGFEHVLSFAAPDWWIADMHSFISQQPGYMTIEALADTEVLLLSKTDQEILYKQVPKFERFFRILIEKSLVANQQRLIDNFSLTAEERYHNLCKRYPGMIESVPQKHIASYLGITPEFLSKLRGRKSI
ncbi:MAG: Crp/Fnr family transcriptional regulator [Cytophagales bacterium]|nr:Crp/Fnr family transcriptional regulator [Cytophaga sp.]